MGLFGRKKKANYGAIYPDPPVLKQTGYDTWLTQLDDLINNWDDIKTGKSMFDAVKFIYEPQKAEMEQLYGINAPGYTGQASTGDLFARGGSIPRTMASMNKSGTLDTGTAGLVQGQMEAQMNKDLAGLFGQAKQTQRNDYINSLAQLQQLYPERYQVVNIPNNLAYFNDVNKYNVGVLRNLATASDQLRREAAANQTNADLWGMFAGNAGNILNNGTSLVNGFMSGLANLFGTNTNKSLTQQNTPTASTSSPFSGYNTVSLKYSNTGSDMFNPYGNTASNVPNQFGASTNPVNKTSSNNFAKMYQSMLSSGGQNYLF